MEPIRLLHLKMVLLQLIVSGSCLADSTTRPSPVFETDLGNSSKLVVEYSRRPRNLTTQEAITDEHANYLNEYRFLYRESANGETREVWNLRLMPYESRHEWGECEVFEAALVDDHILALVFKQGPSICVHLIDVTEKNADSTLSSEPATLLKESDVNGPFIRRATIAGSIKAKTLMVTLIGKRQKSIRFQAVLESDKYQWRDASTQKNQK